MDRWYASSLLGMLSLIALVPAILGVMHMLREREGVLGDVGGGLGLLGAMLAMGASAISMVMWQMAAAGADRARWRRCSLACTTPPSIGPVLLRDLRAGGRACAAGGGC